MSAQDRFAGYRKAVAELGLDDDRRLVIDGESDERITEQRVAAHLATADEPATALVVANNQMTLGTMRALRQCRLKVARDIALVCYDDFEWADLFDPRITAMAQDAATLAARAVDLLLAPDQEPGPRAAGRDGTDGVPPPRFVRLRPQAQGKARCPCHRKLRRSPSPGSLTGCAGCRPRRAGRSSV